MAAAGRSRVERLPTAMLKDWMAERHLQEAREVGEAGRARRWQSARARSPARTSGSTGSLVIGREGDLVIADPEISRRHCSRPRRRRNARARRPAVAERHLVEREADRAADAARPGRHDRPGNELDRRRSPARPRAWSPPPAHEDFLHRGNSRCSHAARSSGRSATPGASRPALLVPLILFVLVSAGLEKATHVKGLPDAHDLDVHARDRVRERRDGRSSPTRARRSRRTSRAASSTGSRSRR